MRATAGADVRMQRIARHGFADRPASSVADAARLTGGLQAQDPQASRLGVRSRAQDLTERRRAARHRGRAVGGAHLAHARDHPSRRGRWPSAASSSTPRIRPAGPSGDARAVGLIRGELTPVDVDGRAGYTLGDVAPGRGVRLLPVFDNYLVGYRERDLLIDAADRPHVYAGGIIRPTVLLDGRVIGTVASRA